VWIAGAMRPAHAVALALASTGIIPAGVECCHRCDVPLCCNPSHLFWGSHTENMRDYFAKRLARGLPRDWPTRTKRATVLVEVA
jgi:hypothetical protein